MQLNHDISQNIDYREPTLTCIPRQSNLEIKMCQGQTHLNYDISQTFAHRKLILTYNPPIDLQCQKSKS